jgi:hypothetical protein
MEQILIALGLTGFIYLCYYKCIVIPRNNKKREELKKKIDKEIKEKEKEFIYEYPELSISSIKNLSQKIVALKYKWIEYDKNIIEMMNYDSIASFPLY